MSKSTIRKVSGPLGVVYVIQSYETDDGMFHSHYEVEVDGTDLNKTFEVLYTDNQVDTFIQQTNLKIIMMDIINGFTLNSVDSSFSGVCENNYGDVVESIMKKFNVTIKSDEPRLLGEQ